MLYHVLGLVSAALFLLTWLGLYAQIKAMKQYQQISNDANRSLSLNQFGSSYFAFYAIFVFGISVEPFNYYLVWTRFGALVLTLSIIWQIWQHRRTKISGYVAIVALIALIGGCTSMAFRPFPTLALLGANTLMLVVTAILFQGSLHQWLVLRRRQKVGSLSFSLFRNILIKDVSTLLFGLTMPLHQSWPLLILNGTSVVMRGMILGEMYRLQRQEKLGVM